ncbi:cytidylyltransferase domain-containing protein [Thermodesulfobacteriota bacterium]
MKIVATIEARMGSTRLPGKVIKEIDGMPSLELQIRRMRLSRHIDEIVLATTDRKIDDVLVDFGRDVGVAVFRGSEDDVLARILGAVQSVGGELHVQTTGDCPLIDPGAIDQVIEVFLAGHGEFDFVSNEITRSYPIGLDCRVFPVWVLEEVNILCDDPIHRVHGSTYIYTGPEPGRYRCHNILAPPELHYPDWRWALDTQEDFIFLQTVARHFSDRKVELSARELAAWLQLHPEIISINSHVPQKRLEEG